MNKIIKSLATGVMIGSMVFSTLGCGNYEIVKKTVETTERTTQTTTVNRTDSIEKVQAFLEEALGDHGTISILEEEELFVFTPDDLEIIAVALMADSDFEAKQIWSEFTTLFDLTSATIYEDLPEYGLAIANSTREDTYIYGTWNGIAFYDISED